MSQELLDIGGLKTWFNKNIYTLQSYRTFGAMTSIQVAEESLVMVVGGDQDPDTTVSTVEILNRPGKMTIMIAGSFC